MTDKELLLFLLTWTRKGLLVKRGPFVRVVYVLCVHVFFGPSLPPGFYELSPWESRGQLGSRTDTSNHTKVIGYDTQRKEVQVRKTRESVVLSHPNLINDLVSDIIRPIYVEGKQQKQVCFV